MQKNIRITDEINLNFDEIQNEINNGNLVTIQYSKQIYDEKLLRIIDKYCESNNESLSIRFFGHYSLGFNCFFLQCLPSVKSLYLDCLLSATNFQELLNLNNLIRLNVGIYEFEEKEFLAWKNLHRIKHLSVTETKNNNVNLDYLKKYENLNTLFVNGHIKNIQSIAKCSSLTYLSLSISSKVTIEFVNDLKSLQKLRLILGGRSNLDEIGKNSIKELEIIRVKGFSSFTNIGNFNKLKSLQIEDQIQLKELNFNIDFEFLEDIKLLNCKRLTSVTGLEKLINLNQLRIYKTCIDFEKFIKQLFPKSLRIFAFYTTKKKVDELIKNQLTLLGYNDGLKK